MAVTRVFLDWRSPPATSAATYLLERCRRSGAADLRNLVVVMPGARAGRRLLEVLVEEAERLGLTLIPPEITTVGVLPELLYEPRKPFANELVQRLAWAEAMRSTDPRLLAHVVAQPPGNEDWLRWLELGKVLSGLHRELAGEVMDFADVVGAERRVAGFNERLRWESLDRVQKRYWEILDGLELWDRQTARRVAIQKRECRTDKEIVLVGMADMDKTMRQMLDQVSQRVTALVYAPSEWADRFDSHGCVAPDVWQGLPLGLRSEQTRQVDGPVDQAQAVVQRIAEFNGRYQADEITIGAPDERIVPQLERRLRERRIPSRWGPGQRLEETGVFRLLQAVASYVERGGFHDFAALVRHPDVYAWIERRGVEGDWLTLLDRYYSQHLPSRLDGPWLGESRAYDRIRLVRQALDELVAGLRENKPLADRSRRREAWIEPAKELLLAIYGGQEFDTANPADRATLKAFQEIKALLESLGEIPDGLAPHARPFEAVRLALEAGASVRIAPPGDEAAVEVVGWLELPLDDAPAAIVTSFNEGFVPKSVNHDMFLPNSLRAKLQLDDNGRRYARDAYALSVLLAPWRDVTLIVGRRDSEGNPLTPSRLLFAAEDEAIAERALSYFAPPVLRPSPRPLSGGRAAERRMFSFQPAKPEPLNEPPAKIRVTGFQSYLACPYRFYLAHILGLEPLEDAAEELDGAAFGSVAHEVLRQFGSSPGRDTTDADQIRKLLDEAVAQTVERCYGKRPAASVSLQMEQLRLRLRSFAEWQAGWTAGGWRIEHVEAPQPGAEVRLVVDGEPILLSGRIDRIDVNPATGDRAILDYKTSNSARDPEKTHRRRGQWVDLQLPLYRHLARALGIQGPVRLGYILLPKDSSQVGAVFADWSEADFAEAEEAASEVVRKVRRQEFWPPREPPPDFSEALAPLCLDGVFGKPKYRESGGA